jgi:hypothetical protein
MEQAKVFVSNRQLLAPEIHTFATLVIMIFGCKGALCCISVHFFYANCVSLSLVLNKQIKSYLLPWDKSIFVVSRSGSCSL